MIKDWTGNGNSIYKTIGASNHTTNERQILDYYATDPVAIDRLLTAYDIPQFVWECACGGGHLVQRLIAAGRDVVATDIIERELQIYRLDFLKVEKSPTVAHGRLLHSHQPALQIRHGVCGTLFGLASCWLSSYLSAKDHCLGGQRALGTALQQRMVA